MTIIDVIPAEILALIATKLRKPDQAVLCQVSRHVHAVVVSVLWRELILRPYDDISWGVAGAAPVLPPSSLRFTKELHFRSDVRSAMWNRCPHKIFGIENWEERSADQGTYASHVVEKARSVLEQFDDGQLHSISWDLGGCTPQGLFRPQDAIQSKFPQLQSLALTIDGWCFGPDRGVGMGFSGLGHLRSLVWIGIADGHMDTALPEVVRQNRGHLERLELECTQWEGESNSDSEDDGTGLNPILEEEVFNYMRPYRRTFARAVLGKTPSRDAEPAFPHLSVLSLTQFHLHKASARVLNFGVLRSLSIRNCSMWVTFLREALRRGTPIRLKRFELQYCVDEPELGTETALADFLDAFEGLEELYISRERRGEPIEVKWSIASRHLVSLRQFVYHTKSLPRGGPHGFGLDDRDLAFSEAALERIQQNPLGGPFADFGVEFIGLSCMPKHLEHLLQPFKLKKSLKVIHIRETLSDLRGSIAWDRPLVGAAAEVGVAGLYLSSAMHDFTVWVFGPGGIASVQVVLFGDFGHGVGDWPNCTVLRRDPARRHEGGYVRCSMDLVSQREELEPYLDAIRACPTPAFDDDVGWEGDQAPWASSTGQE